MKRIDVAPEKIEEIRSLFCDGMRGPEVSKRVGLTFAIVTRVRKTLMLPDCGCGKKLDHRGMCAWKALDPEKIEEIKRRLMTGETQREIGRAMQSTPQTIRRIGKGLALPAKCKCGQPRAHRGLCEARVARLPKAQANYESLKGKRFYDMSGRPHTFEHSQAIADSLVGVPKKGRARTIAKIKTEPVEIRRQYRRTRLALAAAIRLNRPLDRREIIDIMPLPAQFLNPLKLLILKELYEEFMRDRLRFNLWRKSKRFALLKELQYETRT